MDVVITSKIGFCDIVIRWWHMNFICVTCGNHYAGAKLFSLLNVDKNFLPLSVLYCHYGMGIFLLTCKVPAQCVFLTMEIMLTLGNYKIVNLEGMTTMERGPAGFITTAALLCLHLQILRSSMPCHV